MFGLFRKEPEEQEHIYADFRSNRWIINVFKDGLIKTLNSPKGEPPQSSYRVNFAVLQRIRLLQLKTELVAHAADIRFGVEEPSDWAKTLKEYIQALQDYEYMEKRSKLPYNPFYVSGEKQLDRDLLSHYITPHVQYDSLKYDATSRRPWETGGPRSVGDMIDLTWTVAFLKRLMIAWGMVWFLMLPMLLMTTNPTLMTAITFASVLMMVFALTAAVVLRSEMEVTSAAAAYAAVMVVFVGLITEKADDPSE